MHTTLVPTVISHGRSWLDPTVHGHSIGHPVSSTWPESPSSFVACLHEDFAAAPVCVSLYLVSFLLPLGLPRLHSLCLWFQLFWVFLCSILQGWKWVCCHLMSSNVFAWFSVFKLYLEVLTKVKLVSERNSKKPIGFVETSEFHRQKQLLDTADRKQLAPLLSKQNILF